MAQSEIFDWLKRQRLSGNPEYFSIQQVKHALPHLNIRGLCKQIKQLEKFGYVETTMGWPSYFRYKLREKIQL